MCGTLKLLMEIIINTNSDICSSAGEYEPLIGLALVIYLLPDSRSKPDHSLVPRPEEGLVSAICACA